MTRILCKALFCLSTMGNGASGFPQHLRESIVLTCRETHGTGGYYIIPYFFGYKTVFFSFKNNPKNLDLSYKTRCRSLGLFGKSKTPNIAKFLGLMKLFVVILGRGKSRFISKYSIGS